MNRSFVILTALASLIFAGSAAIADELVQRIQRDLVALGYDPGSIQGDLTVETAIAISQFQSAQGIPVTGEPTPLLAGMISAKVEEMRSGAGAAQAQPQPAAAQPAPASRQPAGAAAAQAAQLDTAPQEAAAGDCEPTVADVAEDTEEKARAFGRIAGAFGRFGGRASRSAQEAAAASAAAAEAADATGALLGGGSGC